jgi:hypothetical protein
MSKSFTMALVGIFVYEAVPFGWLFVLWAIVATLPVLLVAAVYLAVLGGVQVAGKLVLASWSRLKSRFRDKHKE